MPTPFLALLKREIKAYVDTPVAYVFIVSFLVLTGMLTFFLSGWYELERASLEPFFGWHPWLYLFFIPAISMRLWAEEKRLGTLELLLTLPVPVWQIVVAKWLAACALIAMMLVCTLPLWITASILGEPDHGVILAGYISSLLMAGSFIAIGSAMSAITRNQVVAFVLSVFVGFLFTASGFSVVISFFSGWLPQAAVDVISYFSFLRHFDMMVRGLLGLDSILYFLALILLWLYVTHVCVESRRS